MATEDSTHQKGGEEREGLLVTATGGVKSLWV